MKENNKNYISDVFARIFNKKLKFNVKKQVPKKKECLPDKKLNEKTNRCVKNKYQKRKNVLQIKN
jgi:hypothetical protein